ncbi:MAG: hypothetical protein QXR60_00460 [Candidatus Nanoarchaeia archaeon]
MNDKNNMYIDQQICDALKEISFDKVAEMRRVSKELGYNSVAEYLISAHELYGALLLETTKGRVIHLLIKDQKTLEKVLLDLGSEDRIIKLKVKGLEYKINGNKQTEQLGK